MDTDHTGEPYASESLAGQTENSRGRPMLHTAHSLLTHDLATEVEHLFTEKSWRQGMSNAKTLVKEADLRIVVVALRRGGRMEEHRAPGCISIHTLTGHLRLFVRGLTIDLLAGQILVLDPNVVHEVEAVDESTFLLTMVWPMSRGARSETNLEMSSSVLAELRALLERAHARLTAENAVERRTEGASDTAASDASTDPEGDLGDMSADRQAWDAGHQELLDREARLAEVEHALGKFALGTYGICEACGRPIPVARLRAVPEARYDMVHQEDMEARMGDTDRPRVAE